MSYVTRLDIFVNLSFGVVFFCALAHAANYMIFDKHEQVWKKTKRQSVVGLHQTLAVLAGLHPKPAFVAHDSPLSNPSASPSASPVAVAWGAPAGAGEELHRGPAAPVAGNGDEQTDVVVVSPAAGDNASEDAVPTPPPATDRDVAAPRDSGLRVRAGKVAPAADGTGPTAPTTPGGGADGDDDGDNEPPARGCWAWQPFQSCARQYMRASTTRKVDVIITVVGLLGYGIGTAIIFMRPVHAYS